MDAQWTFRGGGVTPSKPRTWTLYVCSECGDWVEDAGLCLGPPNQPHPPSMPVGVEHISVAYLTSDEAVDRAAKAIAGYTDERSGGVTWEELPTKTFFRSEARAALAALLPGTEDGA
ncbi:MAG: hypothetical protein QOJ29_3669 [Thermoleophilaceae bacterium]|nr:hypothetical protein [Thermoleophilaceae bacterium]